MQSLMRPLNLLNQNFGTNLLTHWRGQKGLQKPSVFNEYDEAHWLIKEELMQNGDKKIIVKHKESGEIKEIVSY